ncbi:hypothetical protein ACFXAO_14930 [Streptomyces lavendulae]|uniref:hypothetical protein n=1 Tax=Streptomyces lavendulae TaxID=1914 RepID=UPI003674858A
MGRPGIDAGLSYRQLAGFETELTIDRRAQFNVEVPTHIDAISRAMRRTRATENVRRQATTAESVTPHA